MTYKCENQLLLILNKKFLTSENNNYEKSVYQQEVPLHYHLQVF